MSERVTPVLTAEEIQAMSKEEWTREWLDCLTAISEHKVRIEPYTHFRSKPMLGGRFGAGAYALNSIHCVLDKLDQVSYFVAHESTRFVIGTGDSVVEALEHSRKALTLIDTVQLQVRMSAFAAWRDAYREEKQREKKEAWEKHRADMLAAHPPRVASIPKRRQKIFDASEGKCHYCGTVLTLDGKWHIEHKMPKALMGGNEPGNLVASCVTCNHRKKDKTDVEFKAQLAKEAK